MWRTHLSSGASAACGVTVPVISLRISVSFSRITATSYACRTSPSAVNW